MIKMTINELRHVIREAMMTEHSGFTDREIRDWVIFEFLSLGYHTDFLKYLLQFRDVSKSELKAIAGYLTGQMHAVRNRYHLEDEEPEYMIDDRGRHRGYPINHPYTLMRFFLGDRIPNEDEKIHIGMRLEQIGSDRLEDIIDGIHQHRVKYSKRKDNFGRPHYPKS